MNPGDRDSILAQDAIKPIAVIGMAARYPGDASTLAGFWDMISNARAAHSEVPADRWNVKSWYHPNPDRKGTTNVRTGCFLSEDISVFDAPFFSMTAQEASGMDPMQRLMLEIAYESLENAGISMHKLAGTMTSVYCGCFTGDYGDLANSDIYDAAPYQATGKGKAMLSNRVSWFFDLRGSSFTVDTACSSSLYALHLACQSLRLGESKMAIVGGTNLLLTPDMMHSLTAQRFLSPDGISHSFDSRANGYGRGEGIGSMILKPLHDALEDGDTIRAVIRGSGVNQDGRTPGITMPSASAQADLIRMTYEKAGLSLSNTGFFQAHGTGTALGDPVELSALGATFGKARLKGQAPLYVSSVKTNIGHTEGASGLAGLIAAVLSMEEGYIPSNAGWETLNPKLHLNDWKVALPPKCIPWPTEGLRRSSVNSFGYGGANAHVILDDAYNYLTSRGITGNHQTALLDIQGDPDSGFNSGNSSGDEDMDTQERQLLYVFSSCDQAGLMRIAPVYEKYIDQVASSKDEVAQQSYALDIAHTLSSRRTLFSYRSFAVASSMGDLAEKLKSGLPRFGRAAKASDVIWVFTGQGAQWPTMGLELLSRFIFHQSIQKAQAALASLGCSWNLFQELERLDSKRLDGPGYSQPMCTAIQLALIDLMRHWGIHPKAVVGHSSGEIAAAYAAHVISHENAVKVAYYRGVYSADIASRRGYLSGAMLAVGLGPDETQQYLSQVTEGSAVIACYNSPSSVTVSGDRSAIIQLEGAIKRDQKFARQLRVRTAYHSHHMDLVAEDYKRAMGDIRVLEKSNESVPMFSSVTGAMVDPAELSAPYWARNMLQPVRFAEAMKSLLSHSPRSRGRRRAVPEYSAIMEIGPHEALKGPVNQILSDFDSKVATSLTYTSVLRRGQDAESTALEAAATLWCFGHSVDIAKVNGADKTDYTPKALIDLPPYPWNHEKGFWHESHDSRAKRFQEHPRTDLLGALVQDQNPMAPRWRNVLRIAENPWLQDHKIQGSVLFPAAGMLVMVLEAAKQLTEGRRPSGFELCNVIFERGLVIPTGEQLVETMLHLYPMDSPMATDAVWFTFKLFSCSPAGFWNEHSSGTLRIVSESQSTDDAAEWTSYRTKYAEIQNVSTQTSTRAFYNGLAAVGMDYGSTFKNMIEAHAHASSRSAHGTITIPDTKSIMPNQFEFPHLIHPATLDAMFHLLFVANTGGSPMREAFVPVSLERLFVSRNISSKASVELKGYTQCHSRSQRETAGTVVMSTADFQEPAIIMQEFVAKEISSSSQSVEPLNSMSESEAPKRTGYLAWLEDINHWKGPMAARTLEHETKGKTLEPFKAIEAQVAAWLKRLCHKEPELNVLVLGSTFLDICTISEVSAAAIEEAKQNLFDQEYQLDYAVWDFAQEPGFDLNSFDLILAGTQPQWKLDMPTYFRPLRSFLRPGGRMVLTESDAVIREKNSLCQALEESGFQPVETYARIDSSSMAITSVPAAEEELPAEVLLLEAPRMTPELDILKTNISKNLATSGISARTVSFGDPSTFAEKWVISLVEVEEPFILGWNEEELQNFQALVNSAEYVLWITRGGQLDPSSISWSPTTGLLRTLRVEMAKLVIPHLDLSPGMDLTSVQAVDVIHACFLASSPNKPYQPDMEYAEKDGSILIPRFISNDSFDHEIDRHSARDKSVMGLLYQQQRALKLVAGRTGLFTDLRWMDDETTVVEPAADDIEIKASYISLGKADVEVAKGSTLFNTIGRQVSGIVSRVGSNVARFRPGQNVVAVRPEAGRMYVRQSQNLVQAVPNGMSLANAASLFRAYATAHYALAYLANLKAAESILIHEATGDVAQAAVQLAQHFGADVYVTAHSAGEREQLQGLYNIPNDRIFNSLSACFANSVKRATHGSGMNVVLNIGSADLARQAWLCVGEFGRFIEFGGQDYSSYAGLSRSDQTNVAFANLDMEAVESRRPQLFSENLAKVSCLLASGSIGPLSPPKVVAVSEVERALQAVEQGNDSESIVLDILADSPVPIIFPEPAALQLDPAGTYVLSGGLGGLGPSIAELMISRGARHFVFLSRSGTKSAEAREHVRRLEGMGCKTDTFVCDISNLSALESVMKTCAERQWNVRGVLQCAMVLRDSTFENMTHQKWTESTQPKIHGSWNLHETFGSRDLDFFIMLSSVSGIIGNPAQGNYTAGNTYQDNLALYRQQRGLPATALAVGAVMDVGAFADNSYFENFLDKFEHLSSLQVKIDEVMIILQALMKGKTEDGSPAPPLLAMGFTEELKRTGNITSLWPKDRKFDHRIELPDNNTQHIDTGSIRVAALLAQVQNIKEGSSVVENALKANLANAMTASPEDIDADKPLHSYGVDSLKAVEVRNWLFRELKCDVSVFDILSPMSLAKLSTKIVAKSRFLPKEVAAQEAGKVK